ncbi:hypothetical protein [Novosphingobium sp. ST904]|uniref:hypothetical protein n=1 Tax=Novosphingobium sp. ST904 TaxID=1684385 RepID=UPI001048CC03|nr:hypothetical protein [Novosphingobium sp. ST904]TCM43355.1 hypothetical protein EDF59_101459 [Novosphingobium sp. ST904]
MTTARIVQREARDAVIAARFRNGAAPANPYRKATRRHLWWNMGARRAELAVADLMRVGA